VGCYDPAIRVKDSNICNNATSIALIRCMLTLIIVDNTLNNPDTLTKYKDAAQISHKVLDAVSKLCVAGEKIVTICEKGDKLLEEEVAKVYRGKEIKKGMACKIHLCADY